MVTEEEAKRIGTPTKWNYANDCTDIMLASASQAIVIGFHVDVDEAARLVAEIEGVDIRLYNIIYKLIEDVDKALRGMLS